MKNEIRVEFDNKELLESLITKSYFNNNQMGKLSGQKNWIDITPDVDDIFYTVVKGLHNTTIKVLNNDIIDGSFRFIVNEENDSIKIFPISIFCIIDENKKYSFY